ncbi:hypothetical protein SDJN02_03004 [Cucurbita argyrosperma subsp. argyrosperma]|uniref:Uncharacterized protein LOC111437316 n=1 Tax=Cucurbita moschata TaxID=3662 RepID=A0A6J1EX26_CUCMO|nr:uncharacterized protein LOC111437316 [Cucurbita moschata]KAG7036203.1 hypothetical protein SDJN02_03004 [Cucurbita argyrosperma subsp. argyrosperma]
MKSALLRTVSIPVIWPSGTASSSFSNYRPLHGVFTGHKSSVSSPKISLHFEMNNPRGRNSSGIRRASSESDISRSLHEVSNPYDQFGGVGSRSRTRSSHSEIPEEEFLNQDEFDSDSMEDDSGCLDSGIGCSDGAEFFTDTFYDGSNDRNKIGAYYEELLKLNPNDALLLRNYGKFLHEVEKDHVRSEECYSRAILANPSDGELLALYGKLVWESHKDKQRAEYYFDRAVRASPNDCLVIGYYAYFLWQIEDDEEEEAAEVWPAAMVAAF